MIVWGGYGNSGNVNTGGRYNPATDSWTSTSTTNAPEARYLHTAVWTGSEMIVWAALSIAVSLTPVDKRPCYRQLDSNARLTR